MWEKKNSHKKRFFDRLNKQCTKNIQHLTTTNSIISILPPNKTIYYEDMPLVVQHAFVLGPKFIENFNMNSTKIINYLNNTTTTLLNEEEQQILKAELDNQPKYHNQINSNHLQKALTEYTNKNNIIIQNADKNLCIALIDRDIYNEHLNDLTNNNNYEPISMEHATNLIQKQYFTLRIQHYTHHKMWLFNRAINNNKNFGIPNLYLTPKIHKKTLSFRPIVNQRNFIFTDIYKNIHNFYHNKLNQYPDKDNYVLNGNHHFLTKLNNIIHHVQQNNIDLNNYTIASLDIVNLYGNLPLNDIINTIKKTCNFHNNDDLFFYKITNTILFNNIIEINNKIFLQKEGLGMGINYAPSLANYYLYFEFDLQFKKLIQTPTQPHSPIMLYSRFLDDIFLIYKKQWKMHHFISNKLNNINKKIQFTIENPINNSINFLDLTITMDYNNNTLTYTNFIKPLKSNTMLHQQSHYNNKNGLLKSQFIRILKNNNTQHGYEKDCNILINNLQYRGYNNNMIKKNIINYNERSNYFNDDIKQQKMDNWSKELLTRPLLIIHHHSNINIVKEHLRKKFNNPIFVIKSYHNYYNHFFKNHKNTKLTWSPKDPNDNNNNNNDNNNQ